MKIMDSSFLWCNLLKYSLHFGDVWRSRYEELTHYFRVSGIKKKKKFSGCSPALEMKIVQNRLHWRSENGELSHGTLWSTVTSIGKVSWTKALFRQFLDEICKRHLFLKKKSSSFWPCFPFNGCFSASLTISPRTGIMLGGTNVKMSGPCFKENDNIVVQFDNNININATFGSELQSTVTVPVLNKTGRLPIKLSIDGGNSFDYNGVYTSGKCWLS